MKFHTGPSVGIIPVFYEIVKYNAINGEDCIPCALSRIFTADLYLKIYFRHTHFTYYIVFISKL